MCYFVIARRPQVDAAISIEILLFIFQGRTIINNPIHILLIAIPLTVQTYFIFAFSYGWAWLWRIEFPVAAPAGFVAASNFFELAAAVASLCSV